MASVYQRKSDGRWCAAETIGGKRVVRYAPPNDNTRRAARDLARDLERLRRAKAPVAAHRLTTAEHLRSWLRSAVLAPNTRRRYEVIVERHLIPALGAKRLADLRVSDVQAMLDNADGGPQSKRHYRAVIRAALNAGDAPDILPRNPAGARLVLPDLPPPRSTFLTADQAQWLVEGTREDRLHALWALALLTGMRQAECLGLTWADVHLADGFLEVRATLQRSGGQWIRRPGHKTGWVKEVPLVPLVVDALRAHYRQQQAEAAAAKSWPAYALVFTTERGTELYGWRVTEKLYAHEARLGLPRVTFHGLRHSTVTLLGELGVDRKTIAALVGHSPRSRVTEEVYTHIRREVAMDAVAALERRLSGASATPARYTDSEADGR